MRFIAAKIQFHSGAWKCTRFKFEEKIFPSCKLAPGDGTEESFMSWILVGKMLWMMITTFFLSVSLHIIQDTRNLHIWDYSYAENLSFNLDSIRLYLLPMLSLVLLGFSWFSFVFHSFPWFVMVFDNFWQLVSFKGKRFTRRGSDMPRGPWQGLLAKVCKKAKGSLVQLWASSHLTKTDSNDQK